MKITITAKCVRCFLEIAQRSFVEPLSPSTKSAIFPLAIARRRCPGILGGSLMSGESDHEVDISVEIIP
jgi:hypothetical protein